MRALVIELDASVDPEVDAAWLEEAQRGGREIDDGTVRCIPAGEVFDRVPPVPTGTIPLCNAAAPGFTVTAMNNFEGRRTVEEAAREPIRLALLGSDGPTGTFSDENGPIPW